MPESNIPTEYESGFYPYETLRYSGQVDFQDPDGQVAYFSRFQSIRFLENNVTHYIDRVWGDGVLFSFYDAQTLRITEVLRARQGYLVILKLPRPFKKGEVLKIRTRRRLIGAFPASALYWDTKSAMPAEMLALKVVAPEGRRLTSPELFAPLRGQFDLREQPNQLNFRVDEPGIGANYRIAWSWK
jgi:hypothetical protein